MLNHGSHCIYLIWYSFLEKGSRLSDSGITFGKYPCSIKEYLYQDWGQCWLSQSGLNQLEGTNSMKKTIFTGIPAYSSLTKTKNTKLYKHLLPTNAIINKISRKSYAVEVDCGIENFLLIKKSKFWVIFGVDLVGSTRHPI